MTTAVVKCQDSRGHCIMARALLDSCSTVNLVTEKFADALKLPKQACAVNIGAVDNLCTVSNHYIKASFLTTYNNGKYELNFLIVPNIADLVPNEAFPRHLFNIPKNLQLADPQFHVPKTVDVLLASRTTLSILAVGQLKLRHEESQIVLQKTTLGWIVAGGSSSSSTTAKSSCNVVKLDRLLERFWLIEDFDHEPLKSRDEVACEKHYVDHTRRDETGRYIVRLPFRDSKFELGNSRMLALKRFHALERKLAANPTLKVEYERVMEEYVSLGHMTLAENDTDDGYYLPHHAVIKEASETTKVRVVFDASAKTSTGRSLNEVLMVGPTIQNTIFVQLFRFRTHSYVITADIEKMYRQILVHPEDRKFQKILWYHQGRIRTFLLNTVTFGTACAPFLAIRTIQQLARDEVERFPRASKLLLRDFYVDDFISGANSLEEILNIRDEMIGLLSQGGFIIRKWASNHKSALDNIEKKMFDLDCVVKENPVQKTLGITWNSQNDTLTYLVRPIDFQVNSTKRKLLSEISKIFDPLGLVGPVILYAKVLMQDCWKSKITWDESLPQYIYTKWKTLAEQLPKLQEFSMPRRIIGDNPVEVEIHGFCDACSYGYGACLFTRSIDPAGIITVQLICSKSRVAPLSGVTIPRLELCAASILKKLYVEVKTQFDFPVKRVIFWSDSTIVLCWLKKAPHLLRTFESNRVADIQSLNDQVEWRHVRSEDNPADALSRGQLPLDFLKNSLWTCGPRWLVRSVGEWPSVIEVPLKEIPGLRQDVCLVTTPTPLFEEIYSRFSSYDRLVRSFAYITRWRQGATVAGKLIRLFPEIIDQSTRIRKIIGQIRPLVPSEVVESEEKILRLIQKERFPLELRRLSEAPVPFRKKTPFDNLDPFLGENGLIRVGGRLEKSELPYAQKHPVLLPQRHHVTNLIMRQFHETNHHAGVSSTLYALRLKFFVLNGKEQVRSTIRRCVECFRQRPKAGHAKMANLPEPRINESPAFCHTGVDFFGPLNIKEKAHRNKSFLKTYGCVFICMAFKAVHIELAIDLSTAGFLSAFRRFISRRGIPAHVYSDNGTNFVGANKELREIYQLFETPEFRQIIGEYAIAKRINWHFNPPLSPHFGGLWEAAVKSFKHHLKRILDRQLTYEQLNTLLIDIEAILNSRPLYPLSADPNDPLAVTPAHLLIGRPLNALPEKSLLSVPDNRLNPYDFLTKARQNFWNKWHKEYLHTLQTRQKWRESTSKLQPGAVVILMDDVTHCSRWPLGVILETFPGSDGIARVASVKTASGVYKRNITRLCALPTDLSDPSHYPAKT